MNIIVLEAGMAQLEKLKCEGQSHVNKTKTLYDLENKLQPLASARLQRVLTKFGIAQNPIH